MAHVLWDCAETDVDVDQGSFVAWEPARLECDTTAVDGPLGAVVGARHTAAWIMGLVSVFYAMSRWLLQG